MAKTFSHEWMRKAQVNISKYLPAFLASSPEFKASNDADSKEHERLRVGLQDLLDQLYVETATWGLPLWEELVGLRVDADKSLDARRDAVIERLRKCSAVTAPFLEEKIDAYCEDKTTRVIDHPESYSIDVEIGTGGTFDLAGVIRTIRTWIPAHIGQRYRITERDVITLYAICSNYDREILSPLTELIPASENMWGIGFATLWLKSDGIITPALYDSRGAMMRYIFADGGIVEREVIDGA